MSAEIESLMHSQRTLDAHLRNLTQNYQAVIGELVAFQRSLIAQDSVMQSLISYTVSLESKGKPVSPYGENPLSEEAKRLIQIYSDVAKNSYEQINNISRRMEFMQPLSPHSLVPPQDAYHASDPGRGSIDQYEPYSNGQGRSYARSNQDYDQQQQHPHPSAPPQQHQQHPHTHSRHISQHQQHQLRPHESRDQPLQAQTDRPLQQQPQQEQQHHQQQLIKFAPSESSADQPKKKKRRAKKEENDNGDPALSGRQLMMATESNRLNQNGFSDEEMSPKHMGPPHEHGSGTYGSNMDDSKSKPRPLARKNSLPGWTTPPKVLLVEDDEVCKKLSTKFLKVFGCEIEFAVSVSAMKRRGKLMVKHLGRRCNCCGENEHHQIRSCTDGHCHAKS